MPVSDLTVCNLAIDKIGADHIEGFNEDSPLGVYCANNYGHYRDTLLSKYRWVFANRVRLLAAEEIGPAEPKPMPYRFARPADLVGVVHAYRDRADVREPWMRVNTFEEGSKIWADQETVYAEYTRRADEADWPAWFRNLVVVSFAAELAGHSQMRSLRRDLIAEAFGTPGENGEGGLYAQARNEDSRAAPPRQLVRGVDPGPLVGVRGGYGGPSFGLNGPLTFRDF